MRTFLSAIAGASVTTLLMPLSAQAQTQLTGYSTLGDMMDGMAITVDLLGGGSETAIWQDTGSGAGGAFGSDWSLVQSGNTFYTSSPWTLTSSGASILGLTIKAAPGNTVFDNGTNPSTPGSASGRSFQVQSGDGPDSFSYLDEIDISTGDLFATLTMDWNSAFTNSMSFLADTDSGTVDNPITVPGDPADVPEPAALLGLAALGALGLGSQVRNRSAA